MKGVTGRGSSPGMFYFLNLKIACPHPSGDLTPVLCPRFVTPVSPALETLKGGWLLTGYLARADQDGNTYIVDRKKAY